ncbi:MAG TPA: amidohydrolase family protein [Gemmatimonadaceae bacterium]
MRPTMSTCGGAAIVALLLVSHPLHAVAQSPGMPRETAITHVSVVDVVKGGLLTDQTVVVSGRHIDRMGPASSTRVAGGATIVDGRGKFLIPGLWDMHAHVFANSSANGVDLHALEFPLYIANGVTGLRDMWTTLEEIPRVREWTMAEEAGELVGPRVVPTSTMISGPNPGEHHTIVVTTPDAARRVVDSLVAGGARTIKVQNELARDVYLAIADEARIKGVRYVGHVAASMRAREASAAGQHSIEHASGVNDGCSREETEVMRRRADPSLSQAVGRFVMATYDDSTCVSLARFFVEHDTWIVPTFVTRTIGLPDDSLRAGHRGYAYTAVSDRAQWATLRVRDSAAVAATRLSFARGLAVIGLMSRNGVSILAGTDVGNPWLSYGFSLQDELAHMVEAGLSPLEALRTATLNPARFLEATDSLGSVSPAHVADLVLLDADPLVDIRNTRRIRAVMRAGRLYDRTALDSLLATARVTAETMR